VPMLLSELNFTKIVKIRAGAFSGAQSVDGQLYLWGSGSFGQFFTPHRVKSVASLDLLDFHIGRSGFTVLLTRSGQVYAWGANEAG
jgi:alpha-tubulin suppressor-like RCC1 family protein